MVDNPAADMGLNHKVPDERRIGRTASFSKKSSFRWKKDRPSLQKDGEGSVKSFHSCPSPQKRATPIHHRAKLSSNYSRDSSRSIGSRSINSARSVKTTPMPQAIRFPGLDEEEEEKKGLRKGLSFRWRRKKKEESRVIQDQMVADFFDVESFTSDPSLSQNPNICDEVAPKRFRGLFRGLSRRSVQSTRSMGRPRSGRRSGGGGAAASLGGSLHDSSSSITSWQTDSTDGTPRFLIRGSLDISAGGSYQDDDEITLGSAFSSGSGSRSRSRSRGGSSVSGVPRRGVDRTLSENWTSNSRGQSSSMGQKKKKKKGLIKNIFKYFKSKKSKKKARERDQVSSPTEDMEISCSSFDFELELSQMKARYHQEMSSRGSLSSRGSEAMPGSIDIQMHYPEYGLSSSSVISEDGKEEIEISQHPAPTSPRRSASSSMRAPQEDDGSVVSLLTGLLQTWTSERELAIKGGSNQHEAEEKEEEVVLAPQSPTKVKGCLRKCSQGYLKTSYTVAFSVVQIREFERTVGDNPACTSGPPISLGWAYMDVSPDVHVVAHANRPKRSKREFHLPASKRTNLLVQEWQVSEIEIRKARREATYIQYCREKSAFTGGRGAKEASFLRKAQQKQKQQQRLQQQQQRSQLQQQQRAQQQQGSSMGNLKSPPLSPPSTVISSTVQTSYKTMQRPVSPGRSYKPPSAMTCHSPAKSLPSAFPLEV